MGIAPGAACSLFLPFMTSNQNTTSDHEAQPIKYPITSLNLVK